MRERLTIAFVVLAVAVLLGAGTARAFTLRDLLREQDGTGLRHDVVLTGQLVEGRLRSDGAVDRRFLARIVEPTARLAYVDPDGRSVVVRGRSYDGEPKEDTSAKQTTDVGTITLSTRATSVGDVVGGDRGSIALLFLLIAFLAGLSGWIAARLLAGPFQKLAVAAEALGRGRFDLDLPRTRIPEAQAIARSLQTSALQLKSRISREHAFAEHASHLLRTPLTALRLELEELTLRDDVPEDAKGAALRCITCVDDVHSSAGELVRLARPGSLVEGAEVTLHELARQLTERWSDRLAGERRQLSAFADGDLDLAYTPGPVEHVLDLVLADVLLGGKGPVRITFLGGSDHLRVTMPAGVIPDGSRRRGPQPGAGLQAACAAATAQGGRISGNGSDQTLEILLPRR